MKLCIKLITTILIFISNNIYTQNIREQIISEIESIIKPQYGEAYEVDIDFADSLMGKFDDLGLYKFEDPNQLLAGCVFFSAVKIEEAKDSSIFGIYRNNSISWLTPPLIRGIWSSIILINDINEDSKIEIVTNWNMGYGFGEDIWIFSWDGLTGEIINDFYDDPASWQYGFSKINGTLNSFELCDFEDDGILEIRSLGDDEYITFSWNGNLYGSWPNTPYIPSNYFFPAYKLTVNCNAKIIFDGSLFKYSYVWSNDPTSIQKISDINLYGSNCDQSIESPNNWIGGSGTNLTITGWSALYFIDDMILPGQTKDSFIVNCNKYPKIVDYYVQGYRIPPNNLPENPEINPEEYLNDIINNSFHGYTIGPADIIEPFIPSAFIDTLLNYNQRSLELGWITNQTTADKYDTLFTTAKTLLDGNHIPWVENTLQTVLEEVDQDSSDNITSEAYALLRYNTEYLLENLPEVIPPVLNSISPGLTLMPEIEANILYNPEFDFTLTLTGDLFTDSSVIYFNNEILPTTFVSDSIVTCQIIADYITATGYYQVWLSNYGSNSDTLFLSAVDSLLEYVTPVVNCVQDNGEGNYTAYLGYINNNSSSVHIPYGGKNMFWPCSLHYLINRGQPNIFLSGRQNNVFTIDFNTTSSPPCADFYKWILDRESVDAADPKANPCEE